jgi:hypothetical protein
VVGTDADEVHVRLIRIGLGEEADQEADDLAVVALRDEARRREVDDEEALE